MERRKFTREFKLEAVRLIKDRGVSYVQASQDLGVHTSQLRDWVKKFAEDPQHAFPGHGQMKPEQLEIARLKHEVAKLKAERDILKNARRTGVCVSTVGCLTEDVSDREYARKLSRHVVAESLANGGRCCPKLGAIIADAADRADGYFRESYLS
jgi:transposase